MSREILFRGKRVDNGEWVYGCYIKGVKDSYGKAYILPENINQDGCHYLDGFTVIPESVGQFSGLTDKNGAKIFEGDILRFPTLYETPEMCPKEYSETHVVFENGAYFLYKNNEEYSGENTLHYEMYCYDENFEIIGNIHDNPELIRKEVTNGG